MNALATLFSFKGKISRKTYWGSIFLLFLFFLMVAIIFTILDGADTTWGGFLLSLTLLAVAVPFFALQVKRCHDIGWSGWWSLLSFVPYAHWAWWLLLGTITSKFIQEQMEQFKEEEKKQQKRREEEAEAIKRKREEEAEAIKPKQEAQHRIKRAEEYILNSGDPRAISLLLLARKMPNNYAQILVGGMKKGSGTIKNALAVMTGIAAGSVAATVSFAAIQNALDDMQPDIASVDFEPLDEIETIDMVENLDESPVPEGDSGSDFDLGDLFD